MDRGLCHWRTYHTVHTAQSSGSQIWCPHLKDPELISRTNDREANAWWLHVTNGQGSPLLMEPQILPFIVSLSSPLDPGVGLDPSEVSGSSVAFAPSTSYSSCNPLLGATLHFCSWKKQNRWRKCSYEKRFYHFPEPLVGEEVKWGRNIGQIPLGKKALLTVVTQLNTGSRLALFPALYLFSLRRGTNELSWMGSLEPKSQDKWGVEVVVHGTSGKKFLAQPHVPRADPILSFPLRCKASFLKLSFI